MSVLREALEDIRMSYTVSLRCDAGKWYCTIGEAPEWSAEGEDVEEVVLEAMAKMRMDES